MTFTLSTENLYLIVIGVLMLIQIFQWRSIYKLKSETDQIWNQMVVLMATFGKEMKELQNKVDNAIK